MAYIGHREGGDLSAVGALLADPARAAILSALMGGDALPAGELARRADVTPATTSSHLAKLHAARWVRVDRRGRQRYYCLASPEVAALLEYVACISGPPPIRSLRQRDRSDALSLARSCYDHLAGKAGVALTDALVQRDVLRIEGPDFVLTAPGARILQEYGVDLASAARGRRQFARRCLDWSERRDHLAGALGAALLRTLLTRGWVARQAQGRALTLMAPGLAGLRAWGVDVTPLTSVASKD